MSKQERVNRQQGPWSTVKNWAQEGRDRVCSSSVHGKLAGRVPAWQSVSCARAHTHTIASFPIRATTMISCRSSARYPKSCHVIIKLVPTPPDSKLQVNSLGLKVLGMVQNKSQGRKLSLTDSFRREVMR